MHSSDYVLLAHTFVKIVISQNTYRKNKYNIMYILAKNFN